MTGTYSAGTIFLQVVPVFADTMNSIRRQARDLNSSLGDDTEKSIEESVDRGSKRGAEKMEQNLGRGSERSADVFERRWRRAAIEAEKAFGQLGDRSDLSPNLKRAIGQVHELGRAARDVDLKVDGDSAVREIAKVRAALEAATKDQVLNVDVKAATTKARAELMGVQEVANSLDGRKMSMKVDIDGVPKAIGQLTLLQRIFERMGGRVDTLRRQQESSANAFRAFNIVILAAIALLPALIPLVGALGGALVALIPIMAGVATGFGVMLIGFSGIQNAVKALSDVQKNGKKDALAYEKTMRGVAQGVADAHRALARARQSAAQSQADAARAVARAEQDSAQAIKSALQQEADAERALAQAQRDSKQAVDDLREARRQAQQDLEDVADQQRQNLLDIRQAQLDLFNATVQNNAAQADPGSTNVEREQASINLGNAQERLHELRDTQKELKKTAKAGVDGQDSVQQAQDAVVAAYQRQREAAREVQRAEAAVNRARIDGAQQVADALRAQRRTQQQNAQSIQDARRNLRRAEQDYQDALTKTGEIGSTSMANLRDAMGKLGPAGRHFARFIFSLRDDFYELRNAIQKEMLPGVEDGIRAIMRHEDRIKVFARRMGAVIGGLFRRTGRQFANNPIFQQFFKTLNRLGPRFLRQFGNGMLNWLKVAARLMTIAAPWARKFSDALLGLSKSAVRWATSAKGTKDFKDFLRYAFRVGPKVWEFIKNLWGAFKNLVKALAPLGELILGALNGLLKFIAGMDPKLLGVIVTAIIALVVAFQVMAGVMAIVISGMDLLGFIMLEAAGPIVLIVGLVVLLIGVFIALYTQSETFRKIVHKVVNAVGRYWKWMWEHIWKPVFGFIWDIVKLVFKGIAWYWEHVLFPVFKVIFKVVEWLWKHIIQPYFTLVWNFWKKVFTAMKWVWEHILWPVFDLIIHIIRLLWINVVKPIFKLIGAQWKILANAMKWVWNHIIKPLFDIFMDTVGDKLIKAFKTAVNAIKDIWDRVKSIIGKPVKWVIETVLNNGLIKGFNRIAAFVGSTQIEKIPVPDWASGDSNNNSGGGGTQTFGHMGQAATGAVIPGYTPGRDIGYIGVSGGEAVMRPEWTKAIGARMVHYWNKLARTGGVQAVQRAMSGFGGGYAQGGIPAVGQWSRHTSGYPWARWAGDINIPGSGDYGNPVRAYKDGVVALVRYLGDRSYGRYIVINHPAEHMKTLYAHLSAALVRAGEHVQRGDLIGRVGDLGNTTGPHLHFEISGGTDPILIGSGGSTGFFKMPSWLKAVMDGPAKWLKDKALGAFGDKIENLKHFGSIVTKMVGKLATPLGEKISDIVSAFIPDPGDIAANLIGRIAGTGSTVDQVRYVARQFGWGSGAEWRALYQIIAHESSWDPNAANRSSSARGLFQKMTSIHGPIEDSVVGQAIWGLNYIKDRYHDPVGAWNFWQSNGYYSDGGVVGEDGTPVADNGAMLYDRGGYLPPGMTTVLNLTGKPEPVLTKAELAAMRGGRVAGGGGFNYSPTFVGTDLTAEDVVKDINFTASKMANGGKYVNGGVS